MAVAITDLDFHLSGGTSNTDVSLSLGGAISTTQITDNALNNLWDDVTGAEHTAGDTEYRCIYFKNANGVDSASNSKIWIETQPTGDDAIQIGIDTAGVGSSASETLANESTPPAGGTVTFSTPTSGSPISIGTMTAGQSIAVWIKRVTSAGSTAVSSNSTVLKVSVDTA